MCCSAGVGCWALWGCRTALMMGPPPPPVCCALVLCVVDICPRLLCMCNGRSASAILSMPFASHLRPPELATLHLPHCNALWGTSFPSCPDAPSPPPLLDTPSPQMSASLLWPAVPRTSSVSTVHTPSSRLQLPSLGPDTPERTRRARSLRGLLPDRERHFMPLVSAGPVDRRALWTPGTLDPPASRATCSRQSHRADWDVLLDPLYHNPEAFEPQRFTPLKSMFQ